LKTVRPVIVVWAFLLAASVTSSKAQSASFWVGSWAASQQVPEPQNALAPDDLRDATLRQIVHLSAGGPTLRIHLSNAFGTAPLHLNSVHVARPLSSSTSTIDPPTDRALAFHGQPDVTVPAGAEYLSDPLDLPVEPNSDLAISIHFENPPERQTGHPGSRATSYVAHGDVLSAASLPNAKKVEHWYQLSAVDVVAPFDAASIVALGDSITDGHGATTNGNDRWTDVLARRLQADGAYRNFGVLNQGIGGNHLLTDGLGPNALARFDRDVLAQTGVHYLIVLEGVNDLGGLSRTKEVPSAEHAAFVQRIVAAYEQIIWRARAHGIQVIGGTILPYVGSDYYHPGPLSEADRQAVNTWIRGLGHFDAVIDFDQVTRDPAHPERLLPAFDSGDHLHPSPAGYAAMANAIPSSVFSAPLRSDASAPRIAFTFDDLPAHGGLPSGETRLDVASKILAALKEAQLPPTFGFVNGVYLTEHPDDTSVLDAWRAAGNPLGNHGWSHMNLNQHTVEQFGADVTRNEPILAQKMTAQDWHWLRFPYLAEGEKPEKKTAVRDFLLHHGYKVAAVTMSFGDYQWNDPYARCKAKGDNQGIELLAESYLAAAKGSITFYRQLSHTLYGRDIPYVLLMHIGAFDAEMLQRLLRLYQSEGFRFITLEQAEGDPYYRQAMDLSLPAGPDSLEAEMAQRHLPLPSHSAFAPPDNICR
jgi:lysophospholipase L1-like esterase